MSVSAAIFIALDHVLGKSKKYEYLQLSCLIYNCFDNLVPKMITCFYGQLEPLSK
jgi:hypothetical protein